MASKIMGIFALAILALARGESPRKSSCKFSSRAALRAEWKADGEPCKQKLPFELWTLMQAEGSAKNPDAQYVLENCIQNTDDVGLVELITPEGYTMSEALEAAPGDVVSETPHSTTYKGATAATFEAFCADDNILRVTRVSVQLDSYRTAHNNNRKGRRLQITTSEAGQAHQVAELIDGLKDLGCKRTTGEDQTVCVMSDSFNALGKAEALQAAGDLPHVEVVKEYAEDDASDEGSAMIEIMYDIASGATYKFNTASFGEQTFADDIGLLANEEQCDVIVDDISYFVAPAFRDGVIAAAVDEAVDSGSLYFSSAGNYAAGYRFMSNFECTSLFEGEFNETSACGETGVPSHVFQPEANDTARYLYPYQPASSSEFLVAHWDSDIGTAGDVALVLWVEIVSTGDLVLDNVYDYESTGNAFEAMAFSRLLLDDGSIDPDYNYYIQIIHLEEEASDIEAEFLLISRYGVSGESDGSVFGHSCASKTIAVAAMNWAEGEGPDGAFEDPETSPVESFSSRGPCIVSGETRLKPTTTAADAVTTSTPGFESFSGTSASAPAAAAIATIIRAACFPKVVGYDEIMEMLTNYEYTIDATHDDGGTTETWGTEAGHGIISASQMLAWVEANCPQSCPGGDSSSSDSGDSWDSDSYSFGDEW